MQAQNNPVPSDPSIPSNKTPDWRELRAMRRAAIAYGAQMKIFLRRELDGTTSPHTRKRLNKVLDVIALVEHALGRDITESVQ
jgi:hypothetical protein